MQKSTKQKETQKDRVINIAEEILHNSDTPSMQQSELAKLIAKRGIPVGTVRGYVHLLAEYRPETFYRTQEKGSGICYSILQQDENLAESRNNLSKIKAKRLLEENFYPSFAKYLEYTADDSDEIRLDECTKAVPWGGNKSGGIWGTPDVVGVFKPKRKAEVQFPHEIISAEIKIETSKQALITAFGQVCAYRLFSHKVYLAVPLSGKDGRLESLCHIFGIGLVYFEHTEKPTTSIYKMELRAQKHSPDMFYVNEFIKGDLATALYG